MTTTNRAANDNAKGMSREAYIEQMTRRERQTVEIVRGYKRPAAANARPLQLAESELAAAESRAGKMFDILTRKRD